MKQGRRWAVGLAVGLALAGCEGLWRQVDANVVAMHADKAAYMAEFRQEEAQLRARLAKLQAAHVPPADEFEAVQAYLRAGVANLEGHRRSLKFVAEHEKEIARCGLKGLDAAELQAGLKALQAEMKAQEARYRVLLAAKAAKPEAAATPARP